MKLLLFSLALFGIALIAQSGTVEKREAKKEDPCCDANGCKKWCNGKWHDPGKREAVVKRETGQEELMKMFDADNSKCKCLNHGYCKHLKPGGKGYSEVTECSESGIYTFCDSTGCRQVENDYCFCEFGRCEKCDRKGCQIVEKCMTSRSDEVTSDNCQTCTDLGCEKADCTRLCSDDSDDMLFENKCTCKNNECKMCGKFECYPVPDCSRFAKCKCKAGEQDDSYRRCYGYTHGEEHCKTLFKCSDKENIENLWDQAWTRARSSHSSSKSLFLRSCDCPTEEPRSPCKECDFSGMCQYVKKCGPNSFKAPSLY